MVPVIPVEVGVRCYSTWDEEPWAFEPHHDLSPELRYPGTILVIDTETITDSSQALLFASYRLYDLLWSGGSPTLSCVEEGLVYPDDFPQAEPGGYTILVDYCRTHAPAIDTWGHSPSPILRLRSRAAFLDDVFRAAVIQARAVAVFFNAPFDLSRFALHWSKVGRPRRQNPDEPLRRSAFEGGISLSLWGRANHAGAWHDHPARPRVLIKHIDSKRAIKGLGSPAGRFMNPDELVPDGRGGRSVFRGHFLDLRTLAFVLTDGGHTLESACEAFGVPFTKRRVTHGAITPEYIDYNREDVEATAELYAAAMAEYARHPIELQATKAYSPATVGKAYLGAMGVTPPLARLGRIR
jgi:hypothetical protein